MSNELRVGQKRVDNFFTFSINVYLYYIFKTQVIYAIYIYTYIYYIFDNLNLDNLF